MLFRILLFIVGDNKVGKLFNLSHRKQHGVVLRCLVQ